MFQYRFILFSMSLLLILIGRIFTVTELTGREAKKYVRKYEKIIILFYASHCHDSRKILKRFKRTEVNVKEKGTDFSTSFIKKSPEIVTIENGKFEVFGGCLTSKGINDYILFLNSQRRLLPELDKYGYHHKEKMLPQFNSQKIIFWIDDCCEECDKVEALINKRRSIIEPSLEIVNVRRYPEVAAKYCIMSTPLFLYYDKMFYYIFPYATSESLKSEFNSRAFSSLRKTHPLSEANCAESVVDNVKLQRVPYKYAIGHMTQSRPLIKSKEINQHRKSSVRRTPKISPLLITPKNINKLKTKNRRPVTVQTSIAPNIPTYQPIHKLLQSASSIRLITSWENLKDFIVPVFANCSNAVEDLNDLNCREPSGIIPIKRRVNTQKKEQGNFRSNGKWENEQLAKSIATVPGSIPNKAPFNLHPSNLHLLDKELISIDSKIPYVDLNLISRLIVDVKDIHEPLNSVNIAYEGYSQFRNYDFILKSDLDVFITPHFGTYLPPKVQMNKILKRSFVTGTGGYSNDWNNKKFKRMMNELGAPYIWFTQMRLKIQTPFNQTDLTRKYFLKPPSFYSGKIPTDNIGSTWYGSSNEMHLIGAIAMRSALYLHLEEFSPIERGGNLGIMMWPDWHYGVLSMYASHMAIIYLSCATLDDIQGTENVQNPYPLITPYYAPDMLDGGSAASNKLSDRPIDHPIIHIHCWHTELLFSKFQFKVSGYCLKEIMTLQSTNNISSHDLPSNIYSLRMACDSNNTEPNYLSTLFQNLSYLYEI
ncbi:hypothetical protein SNEBB_002798 [Seison nebaliae]|nr:hypothetical protein SNEBB_002798 [Seison nebaliae]